MGITSGGRRIRTARDNEETNMAVSANRLELLQIADAVAREKSIDREIVFETLEEAEAKAARSRYGSETNIRARIDPKTGKIRRGRHLLVVEPLNTPTNKISPDEGGIPIPAAQVG